MEKYDRFLGKWTLVESRNFEEYLKATGAPGLFAKAAKTMKPKQEIKIVDEEFIEFKTIMPLKNMTIRVKIDGSPCQIELPQGGKATARVYWDEFEGEECLVVEMDPEKDPGAINCMRRYLDPNGRKVMAMTISKGDNKPVTGYRIFERAS